MFVAGLRGMAYLAFITFLPLYMSDDLGFSNLSLGFHMGMLVLIWIMVTPSHPPAYGAARGLPMTWSSRRSKSP